MIKIADDDQNRVIRPVIILVKLGGIGGRCRTKLIEVTDHAASVRMLLKRNVVEQPIEFSVRRREHALSFNRARRFILYSPSLDRERVHATVYPRGVGRSVHFLDAARAGTPAPYDPPVALVTDGLYRFVRNPMYVAIVGSLLGQAVWYWSRGVAWYALFVAFVFHVRVVLVEEPRLTQLFGDAFDVYRAGVPRWLPRLPR